MKQIRTLSLVVLLTALFSITFTACKKDDTGPDITPVEGNIVEVASANPEFSILVDAVKRAGLVDVLSSAGTFTVFAPTNAAFESLLTELGVSGLGDIPVETLKSVLLYHVLGTKVASSAVATGYVSTNADGAAGSKLSLWIEKNGSTVKLDNRSTVTSVDVSASNGVIHVIDKVLLPNDVVGAASANPDFSILVQAVVKAGLADALKGLDGATLFAPTNDAFTALLSELGFSSLDDVPVNTLTNILLYHVVDAPVKAADVATGYAASLATGADDEKVSLFLEKSGNSVKIDNRANVAIADVISSNVVIHAIDKVLLPNKIVQMAINDASFSSLVSALVYTELVDALNGDGPFTVFAPTNEAFAALLASVGVSQVTDLPKAIVAAVLLDHVVAGNVTSSGLANGEVSTLGANKITVSGVGTAPKLNGDINITVANIQGVNGVFHRIDKVIFNE